MCEGDMASPRFILLLIAAFCIMTGCKAGPLGPLPNVTSLDLGLKEGGCALGDVVYMPGDEFPGENACERCTCTGGGVQCAKQRCEPRPGCKALHRPDHCCPTYQCECEQEGRVYGNGEKLVDPADPCRVCYCQGGEVVCRRIACFVRDDCTPRHVPGRCCPEYDNCPLRGVTTITGIAPAISNIPTFEEINTSVVPISLKESVKQEITIKEITPVSEIPVITEVKIKEIISSPSIEVAEYSSSKSPLIPREVTSEKAQTSKSVIKLESTEMGNDQSPLSSDSSLSTETSKITSEDTILKSTNDPPSKISFPTQDSTNSNIYTSNIPSSAATIGSPSLTLNLVSVPSSKASMVEEEDSSIFDHNPAFPPLPDDLSVLGNHEDEILTEQNMDNEHVSGTHETVIVASTLTTSTESAKAEEAATTSSSYMSEATSVSWDNSQDMSFDMSSTKSEYVGTVTPKSRENSMLNLRSVMPTEMLNVLPHASEGTLSELNDTTETILMTLSTSLPNQINEENNIPTSTHRLHLTGFEAFHNSTDSSEQRISGSQDSQEHTPSSISKSNVGTEVTSQTELSSLPIETSDQNPHDSSENITKDKDPIPTIDPLALDLETTKTLSTDSDVITVPKLVPSDGFNDSFDNIETTEFVLPSFGSQEITTDGVELIKISADTDRNSAIVDQSHKGNNVLTDLINLVGDVALIGDHTEGSNGEYHTVSPSTISDSEELIPVNAGYKSKNKNWNLNSITEVPLKTKSPATKHKNVEIEDDETDSITDSPPPNDKVEPTTRRPIIDNVSDDKPENKTQNKDIEIITKSYVPTINRRPTKVIMKKSNEKHIVDEITTDGFANSSEMSTEKLTNSDETAVASDLSITTIEAGESLVEKSTDASNSAQ